MLTICAFQEGAATGTISGKYVRKSARFYPLSLIRPDRPNSRFVFERGEHG